MRHFANLYEAVVDLHERGFHQDYQFNNGKLFWIQGKMTIDPEQFTILEYYRFCDKDNWKQPLAIFGIRLDTDHNQGILIMHLTNSRMKIPPVFGSRFGRPTRQKPVRKIGFQS